MPTELSSTATEALTRLPHLQTLDVRIERRIARVTINHQPINLMDATLVGELDQLVDWMAKQGDSVRVVIFQSAVPNFFLAHLDLDLIQATIGDPDPDAALESFQGLVTRYSQLDQVTIAKVEGRVGGGGSELLLNLDLRFAVRGRAVFNQFETGLAILPAGSGSQHLPRLLGRGRALEVILGHDDVDRRALRLGKSGIRCGQHRCIRRSTCVANRQPTPLAAGGREAGRRRARAVVSTRT
jgi:enoyl-CoA hydratase/carnithine racemase